MKSVTSSGKKQYLAIFIICLGLVLIGIPLKEGIAGSSAENEAVNFSEGWTMQSGETVNIDEVLSGDFGGKVVVEKRLPDRISANDSLCFESQNSSIKVSIISLDSVEDGSDASGSGTVSVIEEKEIYSFRSRPNLTGIGYGYAFHEAGLSSSDAGKTIRIEYEGMLEKHKRARVLNVKICPASEYLHLCVERVMVSCIFSLITIFLGIVLVIIYFAASDKELLPFDILSLGISTMLIGVWLLIDTNVMQLLTGNVYIWRALGRVLPFMYAYPFIIFLNSLMKNRRGIFELAGFWLSVSFTFGIILCRYLFNFDMIFSFPRFLIGYLVLFTALVSAMIYENASYCAENRIKYDFRFLYTGMAVFMACVFIDLAIFFIRFHEVEAQRIFTYFGMIIFVVDMLVEFFRWWMRDQEAVERDRFINRALQYAVSSNSPEVSIKSIIKFLGTELNAERFLIFEDQKNGKYKGTYEWTKDGLETASIELMYLPFEGLVDKMYSEFIENGNKLVIENAGSHKSSNPELYNLMKTYHIENMVFGPLEVRGNIFGACGLIGASEESLEEIAEIISLISYFLAQLILQREEQDRRYFYTYNDVLSGTRNQMAYRRFIENELDTSSAFGYFRCNLLGLDVINITEGFDVGDQIVIVAAKCMMEVFGEANVFRVDGTQFVAFGFETEELFFDSDVERVKKELDENGIKALTASVYCLNGTTDISIISKRADDLIQRQS